MSNVGNFLKKNLLWMLLLCGGAFFYWSRYRTVPELEYAQLRAERLDGSTFSMAEFGAQKHVLHFYASWCGPCLHEMPGLMQFAAEHPEYSVVMLTDDPPEKIKRFAENAPNNVIFARVSSLKETGVYSIPLSYISNQPGVIAVKQLGEVDWANIYPTLQP